jgi:multidrug efflux pump subunit AcrA (membrane-fusion protein)
MRSITHYLILTLLGCAACSGGAAAPGAAGGPGGGRGAAPPTGVGIVTLKPTPIEDASEFIATVRSLHSTTVQPQVEGVLT